MVGIDKLPPNLITITLPEINQNEVTDSNQSIETIIKYGLKLVQPKFVYNGAGAGVKNYVDPCNPVIVQIWGSIVSANDPCKSVGIHAKMIIPILGLKNGIELKVGEVTANELSLGQLHEYQLIIDDDDVPLYNIKPLANPQVFEVNGKSMLGKPL